MGGSKSKAAHGDRGPKGRPCWSDKQCYVLNRSPECECPDVLGEEAMFVANNGQWFRDKCAEERVAPGDMRPCYLRGAAWCRANCRDPRCPYGATPKEAQAATSRRTQQQQQQPACRSKGCKPGRRRADCTCPDRLEREAWAAKYRYKHWCAGPCPVYCEMRGPEWCRAHCENPHCRYGPRPAGGGDGGGVWVYNAREMCKMSGRTDGPWPRRAYEEDVVERARRAGLPRLKAGAGTEHAATAKRHRKPTGRREKKALNFAGKPEQRDRPATAKPERAATVKPERVAPARPQRTAPAKPQRKPAAAAVHGGDRTAEREFFAAAMQLIATVQEWIARLESHDIPDETIRELQCSYGAIEVELLRMLEKVYACGLKSNMERADYQRPKFQELYKKQNALAEKSLGRPLSEAEKSLCRPLSEAEKSLGRPLSEAEKSEKQPGAVPDWLRILTCGLCF